MGNFCCGNPSHHSEQEPGLQNEREALLSSCSSCVVNEQITSSQNSVFSQNMSQLQNKIGSAGICNNGAVATKSFPLRASTQTGPDLKVVQDEKDDSLHTAQRIESESNLQKPAGKVQDTNATQEVKLAYTVNGITSAEDHQIDSNSWKRISSLKEEDGEAEMVLDEDEERAKTFQNKQSDCRMEEMNNCQPNDELICASAQVIELVSDTPELKEDLSKDEGSFWEAGIAEETAENMKACNQECFDGEEDLYRDEAEIEKEKNQRLTSESQPAAATKWSTVEPGVDVLEYCAREWKGNTAKAQLMKEAYEAVRQTFSSVRRVRGDNYCALRAALFQILSNVKLLPCLQQDDLIQLPEKLIAANYIWIKQWYFGVQDSGNENPVEKLMEYLTVLKQQWIQICEIDSVKERQAVCEEIFKNNQEEYRLYEAMKILMLAKAIELKNDQVQEKEIPLFCWLLFARDTSADPYQFMKNHLNHVGYTGGLDQVEMFLLGYSLQLTIRVFRLYKFGTDEFVTFYPNDHKEDWPMVTLITEDDRHYNVPVENAQVTQI
ncbi:ubiquitin thioesterase otulin-like isoform X4 [Stegostoma tigrinum]|uniref:ubiquitin thioesterase otulin-like isoform X4 n=1 Tax=Stegostoma tigrinum TaxID=3053191 RepID=UPI00287026DA|nr:ubiquitin thioesterase otulin-like isoform X4 [Stegostoma tigrinum]